MHNNAQFTLALAVTKLEIFMVGEHIKILFQQLRSLGFLSPSFRVVFSLIWSKVKAEERTCIYLYWGGKATSSLVHSKTERAGVCSPFTSRQYILSISR